MNSKIFLRNSLLFSIVLLILAACQTDTNLEGVCQIDLETGEYTEDCFPNLDDDKTKPPAYPIEDIDFESEVGYPIVEEYLSYLLKTWRLVNLAEDGVETKPPFRFLTFYDDNNYAMATEPDLITGAFTMVFEPGFNSLILNPGTVNEVKYQIVVLEEAELRLRTWKDAQQIDEGYEPDDSGCICD